MSKTHSAALFFATAASMAALALFIAIALGIRGDTHLTYLDGLVGESLQTGQSPILSEIFRRLTRLGSWYWVGVLVLMVGVVLLWRKHYWLVAAWLCVIGGGALLERELKELFQRPRPEYASSFDTWSFPSGHAMASVLVCGMAVYSLAVLWPQRWRAWCAGSLLVLITLLVAFSRVYLGQHYLSDVLGAMAAGFGWVAAWIGAIELLRRRAIAS